MSNFTTELEHYIPALRRYAFSLLRNMEMADDLVQDCLERALRKQALWKQGSSMRAWLFTIQHNLYVNQVRSRIRHPIEEPLTDTSGSESEQGQSDIIMSELYQCLLKLPDEQRQVLLLITVEGFAYQEVAKIMNTPLGTVMSRLSRARENLGKLMDRKKELPLRRIK